MKKLNIQIDSIYGYGDILFTSVIIIGIKKIFPNSNIYLYLRLDKGNSFCEALIGDLLFEINNKNRIKNCDIYYSVINNRIYALYNNDNNLYKDPIILQSITNQNKDFGTNWQKILNTSINNNIREYSHNIYMGDLIKRRFLTDFNVYDLKPRIIKNFKNNFNFNKNYITINTCNIQSKKTKMWPESYWNKLINYIKYKNKNIEIYHLGINGDHLIQNKFINYKYFNNIDIFDSFNLMQHSKLHIGTEGSYIHAGAILGNRTFCIIGCCGKFYEHPYNNITYFSNEKCGCKYFPCAKYCYELPFYNSCKNNEHLCMINNKPENIINYIEKKLEIQEW